MWLPLMTGTGSPAGTEQIAPGCFAALGLVAIVAMGQHYSVGSGKVSPSSTAACCAPGRPDVWKINAVVHVRDFRRIRHGGKVVGQSVVPCCLPQASLRAAWGLRSHREA